MHTSSTTRSKASFVPWLAALVLGATAHVGWLVHELRDSERETARVVRVPQVIVELDMRGPAAPSCQRFAPPFDDDESDDLDLWIHRTGRYTYSIDRRVLDQVALADSATWASTELGRDGAGAVELRNIRYGTALYLLGLRNGDRLLAIARHEQAGVEHVEVSIERRGARLLLTYEIA